MAVEKTYTGDGLDTTFDITFPFVVSTDVNASINGVSTSAFSITGSVLTFTTAPANGAAIRIYRTTDIDTARHTYTAGSAVKADALNENHKQLRFAIEEVGTVTANDEGLGLVAGSKGDIHVNTATDWFIRDGVIENAMIADNAIQGPKIADGSVTSAEIGGDAVNGSHIADNSIDSEHYVNKSIDAEHIQDNTITSAQLGANSVTNNEMADDAVGIAELSASGTASSSTCLRGDNSWATLPTAISQLTNDSGFLSNLAPFLSTGLAGTLTKYTTAGTHTYSPPSGTTSFIVICVGAGGGSGSVRGRTHSISNIDQWPSMSNMIWSYSHAGGSGGTSISLFNKAQMGNAGGSIVVGAGGSAGTSGSGGTGGATSFDPDGTGGTVSANGGNGSDEVNSDSNQAWSCFRNKRLELWSNLPSEAAAGSGDMTWKGPLGYSEREYPRYAFLGGPDYGAGAEGKRQGDYGWGDGNAGKPGLCIVIAF